MVVVKSCIGVVVVVVVVVHARFRFRDRVRSSRSSSSGWSSMGVAKHHSQGVEEEIIIPEAIIRVAMVIAAEP